MSVLTLNLFRKDESTSLCVAVGPSFLLLYNIPPCSYTAVDLYALFIGLWGIFFFTRRPQRLSLSEFTVMAVPKLRKWEKANT